ncbi:MAG: DUF1674 domain-containing protein [Gammaproteobacteria bacterium]|nr:DUF1674 domain-containing protein [Gammaproteobacteria bacterium]MDH3429202.1 DUF1674 domain-containing protein [Gammaproteobacteria bacterium]
MPAEDTKDKVVAEIRKPGRSADDDKSREPDEKAQAKEIGGREGPDPTRYGDWEKAGRCIDF